MDDSSDSYVVAGDGSVYDSGGNVVANVDASYGGTNISSNEIASLTGDSSWGPIAGQPAAGVSASTGGGSTSWISGLGSLFGTIGTVATNLARGASSSAINPATGVRYGINPATGLPYPAVSAQKQNSLLIFIFAGVVLYLVFRKG